MRKNSPIPLEIKILDDLSEEKRTALEQLNPVKIQIQAALTVIGRRNPDQDNTQEDEEDKSIDLSNSNLFRANLFRAKNLSNTQIKSACFWEEAIYTDADWNEKEYKWVVKDEQANQQKIEEIRQDHASDPTKPPDCLK